MIRPMPYPEIYKLAEGPAPSALAARAMFVEE
jgi:hypothetical protein